MKTSVSIALGVTLAAAAVYFWQTKKKSPVNLLPQKENERHHLTDLFSRAKQVAVGN